MNKKNSKQIAFSSNKIFKVLYNMYKYNSSYIFVLLLMLIYFGHFTSNKADYDLWGYLSFGRLFWKNNGFPYYDVFSYMPTKTIWVYHEWLTGVILFKVHQYTGMTGLQLLRYSVGLIMVWMVFRCAVKTGSKPLAVFIVLFLVGGIVKFGFAPVRAQVFTYLFYVLSIYLLESTRKDGKWNRLWWLIPLQLIWCNMHGGFVAGLCIIGLYTLGETISGKKFWPYALVLTASFLVTFLNPYGIQYWAYILQAITMPRPFIIEWFSVPTALKYKLFVGQNIFYIILILLSATLLSWYHKKNVTVIMILAITAFLGFMHIRHMIFFALSFGIFMPVIFTASWESFINNTEAINRWSGFRIPCLIFSFLFVAYVITSSTLTFVLGSPLDIKAPLWQNNKTNHYPVKTIEYIKYHNLKGNILCDFNWGEYIMWNCHPDCLVGMDGRYESVYPDQICNEYFDFYYGKTGWQLFLDKYPHDMIVVESDSIVYKLVKMQSNWKIALEDKGSALFIRK